MKKLFFLIISFIGMTTLNAQINFDGTILQIDTCDTYILYDSGGPNGNYSNNENFTMTLCPSVPNSQIKIDFLLQDINDYLDLLFFYDGTSVNAPSLGYLGHNTQSYNGIQASASNTSGCITLEWSTNGQGTGQGFELEVSCQLPCQSFYSELTTSFPVTDSLGYIDICPYETVTFNGQGNYFENDTLYTQADSTSTFKWLIEGVQYTGQTATHTFQNPGGHKVQLEITDAQGCKNTNLLNQKVRVAPNPTFNNTQATTNTICLGDTVTLQGHIQQQTADFTTGGFSSDTVIIPNPAINATLTVSSAIIIDGFASGQTVNDTTDIIQICTNLNNKEARDLEIKLICPSGQSMILHDDYLFTNPTWIAGYFGSPFTGITTGLDYCWTPTTNNPTIKNAMQTNPYYLSAYDTDEPFTNLLGCPLNGVWTLEIMKVANTGIGHLYNWSIDFADSLYLNNETFTPQTISKQWLPDSTIIGSIGDSIITVVPTQAGTAAYTFTTSNNHGCSYDTTVTIAVGDCLNLSCNSVFDIPHLEDTTICPGESFSVDATIQGQYNTRTFTYAATGQTIGFGDTVRAMVNVNNIHPNPFNTSALQSVCLDIDHNNPEDLDIYLITPSGFRIELSTDNGSGTPNAYDNTCFVVAAPATLATATPPFTGNYRPEQSFMIINTLNNINPNGTWTLEIMDDNNPLSNGSLNNWSITFKNQQTFTYFWTPNTTGLSCTNCPNPIITPTNTADYIVAIQGSLTGCIKRDTMTVTVLQPLSAPTITCNSATQNTLNFTWSAIPNAASYEVNINNTGWQPSSDSLGHWVLGLSPNQTVNIQVRGVQNECTFPSAIGTKSCTTLPCDVLLNLNTLQSVTCPSGSDGSISLSANSTNLLTNYFYNNTTNIDSSTTGIFNNLTAGIYFLTATDSIGCTDTMTVTLTEPNPIIANETIINNACFGENNGSITLNSTGGTPPFSYFWSDNSTNNSLVNLVSDTYLVTITDGANCIVNTNFNINQPDSISTILTATMTTDCNGNDGTATVLATGGTPNYTYLWNNNDNTATANNLTSGTAIVTVTDANNCVKIDSVTVLAPEPITFSVNHTDLICHTNNLNGTPLGTITINILSGTTYPNYEYSINCGVTWQNTNTFTNLSVGNYDATVRYFNATCQTTCQSITITQPDSLDLSFTTSQVTCYGLSDGTATVSAVGGNGNFSYLWNILMNNNNQNTATAINLQGGFFEVTVTDGNTCQTSDTVYVYAPVLVNIDNLSSTPTLCYGSNEGTISATASGGTGAKNYTWTSFQNNSNQNYTGSNVTNLYAGNYILTAADAQGCIAMDSVLVTQPDSLAATFTVDSLTCFNNNSGSATVSVLGGTPSYSFIWNNNTNINQANNLASAFAIVTITDANNCILMDSVFVPQPLSISLNMSATQVSCFGQNNGTATVLPSGGTGIYNYLWSNNSQNNVINNLSGGGYTVTVSDANNCSANGGVFVLENPALFVLENKNNVSCFNNNDGNITLLPNGGTGIYTFQWQNSTGNLNISDSILNNISVGIYTYIVTDSDGCNYSDTVEITEPQPLGVTLISINPTCLGGANGTATATVSGGTSPYNYTWSRQSQNAATVQNLTGGWINLTVTDANNCTIIDSVFVQQPQPISITTTSTSTTCIGGNDGTATATVTGGLGNYTYIWTTQNGQNFHQNTATATNLQSGQYFVAATDTNNCTVTDSVFVSEPEPLEVTPIFTPISCFGANNGSIYLTIENINNYTFQWNTNPTDAFYFINNLESKNYIVTITDSLNCVTIDTIFIDEPTEIISNFEIKNISCNGKNNGEIKIQTTGGTPFYQYNFANNGFSNTNCFIGLSPNNYEIITKDANGCEVTDTIEITEPQAVEVNLGDDILTELGNQIEVTATVTNGISPFIYHWNPADSLLSCYDCLDVIITTNEAIKRYDFIVTDANGCIGEDFIIIRTHKNQTIFVANAFTPNGDGNNDVLFVQGSESIAKSTFQVFDRWGELLFETKDAPINDENFGWNGSFRNEKMNSGIFVWVAEVTFEDGSVKIFRGSTFLMR